MSFREVMGSMDWSYLLDLLISVIPAIICITIHEMSHGLAAKLMGDDTAETQRRLYFLGYGVLMAVRPSR